MPKTKTELNRTVKISYLQKGNVGHLYKVEFVQNGVVCSHWPTHEEGLAGLIKEWIILGIKPK